MHELHESDRSDLTIALMADMHTKPNQKRMEDLSTHKLEGRRQTEAPWEAWIRKRRRCRAEAQEEAWRQEAPLQEEGEEQEEPEEEEEHEEEPEEEQEWDHFVQAFAETPPEEEEREEEWKEEDEHEEEPEEEQELEEQEWEEHEQEHEEEEQPDEEEQPGGGKMSYKEWRQQGWEVEYGLSLIHI